MILLIGLGNPGASYARTRHNIGFMAVDRMADHFRLGPWRNRFHGLTAEGNADAMGDKILALKPETYMNNSGQAANAAMQFYKIGIEQVFVFHDELDLPCGRVRVKRGGGSAGHNGLRSLDQIIGPDYWRIRLGIGHPGDKAQVSSYVLSAFAADDKEWLESLLHALPIQLPALLKGDESLFMTRMTAAVKPKPEGP